MIKANLGELIIGYIGFVIPLYFFLTPNEANMIAFFVFIWTQSICIWSNCLRP